MRDRDAKILTEMYSLVRENEAQPDAPSIPPEAQKKAEEALKQLIDSLTPEQKEQLKQALQSGQDLNTAIQQIQGEGGQNVQAESYIEEGLGRRLMSRAAGLGGIKDNILGAEPGKQPRDYQNDKFTKRYEIFKNAIGKHLKELQLDLKTVKNVDPEVKQKVDQIVTGLASSDLGGIKPSDSKFQEFRHGAGRVVQGVGTAAAIATPLALLTAPLVTSLGTAAATKAGVGALTSVAMDLLNGQKPSWKKALAGAAIGGAIGAGMYGLQNAGGAGDLPKFRANPGLAPDQADNYQLPDMANQQIQYDPTQGLPPVSPDLASSIKADWPELSKTVFGQMGMKGDISSLSKLDNTKLGEIVNYLKQNNLDWSQMNLQNKAKIFDAFTGKNGRG
jgi:hypothetical protein